MGWFSSSNKDDVDNVDVLIQESEAAAQDIENALQQMEDYDQRQQAEADELIEESNGLLGKLFSLFGVVVLFVALTTSPVHADGRRDGEQSPPEPTPSISTPPDVAHVVFLPIVASDYVEGSVSWRPGGSVVEGDRWPMPK